jgi:cell wall-associated NlpC family hydrolase
MSGRKGRDVPRLRRAAAPLATLLVAVCCGLSTLPAAVGDPGGPGSPGERHAFPSQGQVDRAREAAARKAQDVSVIRARMVRADQRLDVASLRAEQASEAYNGARWRLQQAKDAYRAARTEASRARRTLVDQRSHIGALVAQSYQQGGDLSALNALMSADGPEGVLDQYAAFQGASTSLQADYQRFTATDSLARVFETQAARAKAEQATMADRARQAQARAVSAARAAQEAAAAIAAEKRRLVHQLARAQHVSVTLAQARQAALEAIARRQAEERARREAARAEATAAADAARHQAGNRTTSRDRASDSAPVTGPVPAPAPVPVPSTGGGAQQAIRFAQGQLGEPYRWGAAGPGSWDCSGLTMQAWASAGMSLPHYSVAQYSYGTPIPVSEAGPGDLLFWSSNGRPSGIHHVALSLGGGQYIEAPHTGASVRYSSVYSWYPTFAVRL